MTCYRVVRRRYADLRGEGARIYGGRCNPPGIAAVYSSENIALAVLEVLVHVDKSEMPNDYVVMAIRCSGKRIYRVKNVEFPELRRLTPSGFRASYLHRPIFRVPSVIVPREYNYVLLPDARGFEAEVEWTEPLEFDRRLLSLQ
jgi:RES domain-containing protein